MAITSKLIKELRAKTGVGVLEGKKALEQANGDIELAIEYLRKQGGLKAQKVSGRMTKEGLIHAYIHPNGRLGVLIELNSETDFVARNETFRNLANDLAMHIAATDPQYITANDVPLHIVEKEKEIYQEQLRKEGKDDTIIKKAVLQKLKAFYAEVCLLSQPFIKDESMTVEELIQQKITALGENITVSRFVRFSF